MSVAFNPRVATADQLPSQAPNARLSSEQVNESLQKAIQNKDSKELKGILLGDLPKGSLSLEIFCQALEFLASSEDAHTINQIIIKTDSLFEEWDEKTIAEIFSRMLIAAECGNNMDLVTQICWCSFLDCPPFLMMLDFSKADVFNQFLKDASLIAKELKNNSLSLHIQCRVIHSRVVRSFDINEGTEWQKGLFVPLRLGNEQLTCQFLSQRPVANEYRQLFLDEACQLGQWKVVQAFFKSAKMYKKPKPEELDYTTLENTARKGGRQKLSDLFNNFDFQSATTVARIDFIAAALKADLKPPSNCILC